MKELMNKTTFLLSVFLGLSLVPLYASAQVRVESVTDVTVEASAATDAQIFTACSQSSIELRDSAIGSARTAYNNAMTVALDARKEAEKKAVALENAGDKKAAIKVAVEDYKKAVTQAQGSLVVARKEAWSQFEENMKLCRDAKSARQDASTEAASGPANLRAEMKAETGTTTEKSFFGTLMKFFKKGE